MNGKETIRRFIETDLLRAKERRELSERDPLIESGIIDSLGIIRLLEFLEERFSIAIADDDVVPENFETIEAISSLVDRKIGLRA
jgi:acyl carrier protein